VHAGFGMFPQSCESYLVLFTVEIIAQPYTKFFNIFFLTKTETAKLIF
jgi:hypothetical protein